MLTSYARRPCDSVRARGLDDRPDSFRSKEWQRPEIPLASRCQTRFHPGLAGVQSSTAAAIELQNAGV